MTISRSADPPNSVVSPWRTEGLFSPHYLTYRLPRPQSALWPDEQDADAAFEFARTQFTEVYTALKTASEEDVETRWILPMLRTLGYYNAYGAGNMDAMVKS